MTAVGELLRGWRERRRLTQADLAEVAEVSARHLSCVERGRARPSRQMVLVLASALEIPLRERNLVLAAGGYAPVYRETDLAAPEMASVRQAISLMLRHHEPFPAVVVDAGWDVLVANEAWRRMCAWMGVDPDRPMNAVRTLVDPAGLGRFVVNRDEVLGSLRIRLRREALVDGNEAAAALLAELGPPEREDRPPALVVPVQVAMGGARLSLFSTLTTIGTPTDITLSELRIEAFHAADAETDALVRAMAAP